MYICVRERRRERALTGQEQAAPGILALLELQRRVALVHRVLVSLARLLDHRAHPSRQPNLLSLPRARVGDSVNVVKVVGVGQVVPNLGVVGSGVEMRRVCTVPRTGGLGVNPAQAANNEFEI